jgi:hypothetical protein
VGTSHEEGISAQERARRELRERRFAQGADAAAVARGGGMAQAVDDEGDM